MTDDIADFSLTRVASLIRDGEISSVEATRSCLARIEAWQPKLNAFIAVEASAALAVARRLDNELRRRGPRGPLHGVPLAHKDMYYRRGKICSAGSKIRARWVAPFTATVMARLDAAGAVTLGRLSMAEFAADGTGHNQHYGPCRNAWNPAYMAGGSSSGAGAAVAARLAFGALGSDTGGSIRLPAAANGIVGLMPTQGRVSRHGAVPRSWSLDRVGPMARSARDCARLLRVIAGRDPHDGLSSSNPVPNYERLIAARIRGLTIGIPDDYFFDDVSPDVGKRLDDSLRVFRALGAKTARVRVPNPITLFQFNDLVMRCEAAVIHGRWLRERGGDYADYLQARLEGGLLIPATRYIEALTLRGPLLAQFLEQSLGKAAVLFCPLIAHSLPTLKQVSIDGAAPRALARAASLSHLTRLFNFLGVPALSAPCGFDRNGLPAAFQLVAPPFAEGLLLAFAHAYQRATDWHLRSPGA
jgi:aspartyl-tRNA(Asn)/glutamyl-tRNA(Gln) amidotransferase subunit A